MEEIEKMDRLFNRLFPICRSITGAGVRKTLNILNDYIPLDLFSVNTGAKIFDWEIPKEWNINKAWLKEPNGEKIIDFNDNNLHVLNYSAPVDKKLTLEELKTHLNTLPEKPNAIPYVTSYYKRRWGLCLRHKTYENLKEGIYHVYIDSELKDGELNYAHKILPGESEKEILISSYICHPSMANNELSGPIAAAFLYNRIKEWEYRRFNYRFVFLPETIGSLTYLKKHCNELKENLYSGLVLTCLGGKEESLSYKCSRRGNAPIDKIIKHFFTQNSILGEIRPFTPIHGSDERQYCSPGFNLPVGQMARMVYGDYYEYHTSLDDKDTMTIEAVYNSVNQLEKVFKSLELDGYYINQNPYGEVKLDRHNLYPDKNSPNNRKKSNNKLSDGRKQLNNILTVLNYSDGKHSLREIAEKCNLNILDLNYVIQMLKQKELLKGPYFKREAPKI